MIVVCRAECPGEHQEGGRRDGQRDGVRGQTRRDVFDGYLMTGFIEFDEYLAEPFPVDHWEDDAIGYAQQLIASLAPADWEAFERVWVSRPVRWQVRAAQVLSHGLPVYAAPLLLCMTESEDLDVVEAAADSLRDFGSPESPLAVPAALIQRLDRLTAERPGPVARAMADLRRRIRVV
jgi:hypothetical protein